MQILNSAQSPEYLGQGAAALEAVLSPENVEKGTVKPGVLDAVKSPKYLGQDAARGN
jgi:hypothetical protein